MGISKSATSKSPPISPPDPGAEERLRVSACSLFAEKGYAAATVREIIEGAGVTRPVLYYYFRNKEDLYLSLIREAFEEGYRDLDQVSEEFCSCRDRLREIAQRSISSAQTNRDVVRMLLRFFLAPSPLESGFDGANYVQERLIRLNRVMQDGIESGELAPGNSDRYVLMYTGLMDIHVMRLVSDGTREDPDAAAEEIIATLFDGIAARQK